MQHEILIHPPYSMIFISDESLPSAPEYANRYITASNDTILVPCAAEQDGPTRIVLAAADDVGVSGEPAFDGAVETPGRRLVVSTALLDIVLSAGVRSTRTRVRIWTNDPSLPDEILVAYD